MTEIASTGRVHRSSSSGMTTQRKFDVDPFKDWLEVAHAAQGSVTGSPGNWTRTLPAKDPYVETNYCNEVRVDLEHPDLLCSSDKLGPDGGTIKERLELTPESPTEGAAGAKLTATYRPLITSNPDAESPHHPFDWMNATFNPGFVQVPWPEGLFAAVKIDPGAFLGGAGAAGVIDFLAAVALPKDLALPISVPVIDFSIRRILVGEPPWETINALAGKVNAGAFPRPANDLPTFPAQTLLFDDVDVINRLDAKGNRWYELVYNFRWIKLYDEFVVDKDGNGKPDWVTWNHALMRPWWLGAKRLGWYSVHRRENLSDVPFKVNIIQLSGGPLYTLGDDFMPLFDLNSK